ncbi:MAG TPA: hypothetical protein VD997_03135 [Phycisphaerales bacterium]|nr:hypothetical protein [Phycisphaerales bacterium]
MARKITISISDDLEARIAERAKARGLTLEECAAISLSESLIELPRVPATQKELEVELLKGLEGPGIAPDRAYWERKKAELVARYTRNKAG